MASIKEEKVLMSDDDASPNQDTNASKHKTSVSEKRQVNDAEETNETKPSQAESDDVPSTMTMIFAPPKLPKLVMDRDDLSSGVSRYSLRPT
jgi:hypothetical protein